MSIKERREREKKQRRQDILDAALTVLNEEGFYGVSMDKIAEKAELSKGALYLYFESKGELFNEIFWMRMNNLIETLEEVMSAPGEFEDILKNVIQTSLDFYSREVELFRFIQQALFAGGSEFISEHMETAIEFNKKAMELGAKFYARFDVKKFRYTPTDMNVILGGIIKSFLIQKFIGVYKGEITPELISDIFLRGVLK